MDFSFFIAKKIAFNTKKSFSNYIILISTAAVVLSVSTMIVAVSFVNGFQQEIREKVFSFWGHIHVVPYSLSRSYNETGITRYPSFTKKSEIADIEHIQAIVTKAGLLKSNDAFDGIVIRGVDTSFLWSKMSAYMISGDVLSKDSALRSRQLLISQNTAKRLSLNLNDKVIVHFPGKNIQQRAFRICGIYETGIEEFDKEIAFGDMRVLQELNGWDENTVSSFEVFLRQGTPLFKSKLKAYGLLFFGGFLSDEEFARNTVDPIDTKTQQFNYGIDELDLEALSAKDLYPGLFDWLELQNMNELIILILMVLVASINMITALLIFVLERTSMIGLLKSMGASSAKLIKVFLIYGAFVIIVGVLLGDIIGIGLCLIQQKFHVIKLSQDSYYIRYAPIALSYWSVLAINLGTLLLCLIALLLPLRVIKNISPIKAIKFD